MNVSEVLEWLEEESDRLTEECHSNSDPYKTVNNSFLEGFNYALANVQGLEQPQLNENQQIVLEWLKEEKNNSKLTAFDCIYSFIYGNPEDLVTETWAELNAKEEAQVLEAFGQWVLEQEE